MTTLIEAVTKALPIYEEAESYIGWAISSPSMLRECREATANIKQAIAQEQSMSPKSVSGTSERSCETCKNRHRRMDEEPCRSCHGYTNWEPKP